MIFYKESIIEDMPNFDNFDNECNPNHICENDEHEVKTTKFFS